MFLEVAALTSLLQREKEIFSVLSMWQPSDDQEMGWVEWCFTSRAVGVNCCDSVQVRPLLWKILISEGTGFLIDSYHPIPGEEREEKSLTHLRNEGVGVTPPPTYVHLTTGSAKRFIQTQNKWKEISPIKSASSSHSALLFGDAVTQPAFQGEISSLRAFSKLFKCLLSSLQI